MPVMCARHKSAKGLIKPQCQRPELAVPGDQPPRRLGNIARLKAIRHTLRILLGRPPSPAITSTRRLIGIYPYATPRKPPHWTSSNHKIVAFSRGGISDPQRRQEEQQTAGSK